MSRYLQERPEMKQDTARRPPRGFFMSRERLGRDPLRKARAAPRSDHPLRRLHHFRDHAQRSAGARPAPTAVAEAGLNIPKGLRDIWGRTEIP
jgi:hypothetical protein